MFPLLKYLQVTTIWHQDFFQNDLRGLRGETGAAAGTQFNMGWPTTRCIWGRALICFYFYKFFKNWGWGWEHSSVAEYLTSMYTVLGSIPSITKCKQINIFYLEVLVESFQTHWRYSPISQWRKIYLEIKKRIKIWKRPWASGVST